ncbi:ATP synthase delta subunit-domain-containing protein [Glomus cerebriforme]|uniref:ATP synthase subunit 5, mitochondrial n=1 Tax=Glomus cerebriforme TaxID=658196 RepID=A0A397TF02_9GLOM|nr:ATP synthase delta subunit-domain-containing protein [Glomus cerebriforme]
MASFTSFNLAKQALNSVPKVPLTLYGIEGRYATALFTAATKKEALENVETELKKIKTVIEKDSKIRNFLDDPTLSRQNKKSGIQELLKDGKYSETTKNFFIVLAENGRLSQASKIINAYQSLMTASRGEVPVTVISAKQLDSKIVDKLKPTLSKFLDPNQKIVISNKVNPSILGGLVVEIGSDKTIDLSVSSKLAKLNKLLTGNAQEVIMQLDLLDKRKQVVILKTCSESIYNFIRGRN